MTGVQTCALPIYPNDVEMLNFTGLSIAMGNGVPEAKAVADYVTDDIDKDGWANGIKHFKLID